MARRSCFLLTVMFCLLGCDSGSDNVIIDPPISQGDSVRGIDIALQLKRWCLLQPTVFTIGTIWASDTADTACDCANVWDLISNVVWTHYPVLYDVRDTLVIMTSFIDYYLEQGRTQTQLREILASLSLTLTEDDMVRVLTPLKLKLQMKLVDSTTLSLGRKLLDWAKHQHPPKEIHAGYYPFVAALPNAGGYSQPWFYCQTVQNLQYFTKRVGQPVLQNIVSSVDTSLTSEQLRTIMLPVAPIKIRDTFFGIMEMDAP